MFIIAFIRTHSYSPATISVISTPSSVELKTSLVTVACWPDVLPVVCFVYKLCFAKKEVLCEGNSFSTCQVPARRSLASKLGTPGRTYAAVVITATPNSMTTTANDHIPESTHHLPTKATLMGS
jgi:hypothetical protein